MNKETKYNLLMVNYHAKLKNESEIQNYYEVLLNEMQRIHEITKENFITLEDFIEIIKIDRVLLALENYGITSGKGNHTAYVKKYNTLRSNALEFGIQLPKAYPYSNPTNLLQDIESILKNYLGNKQRTTFYNITGMKSRVMRSNVFQSKLERNKFHEKLLNSIPSDEELLKQSSLTDEEHRKQLIEDAVMKEEFKEELEEEYQQELQEIGIIELSKRLKYTPS